MDDHLLSFIEEVTGESHLRVESDLGDGFVRLRSAEAERRQARHDIRCSEDIVIELLRNARDAHAKTIFLALNREADMRRIVMVDDGIGIPSSMRERIFEPRVTSKLDTMHLDKWGVHGRGMALYSIRENTKKAYVQNSGDDKGTALVVEADLEALPEKADQSTMPVFTCDESENVHVRGPHNIMRTAAEFAFEHRDRCTVYCGSAIDIAATLLDYGLSTLKKEEIAFCDDPELIPLCQRLATAGDPSMFVKIAAGMGMEFSERSARRILDGEVKPLCPLHIQFGFDTLFDADDTTQRVEPKPDMKRDARGLKIAREDLEAFSTAVSSLFDDIAQRYYLDQTDVPKITVTHDAVHIKIEIAKLR